jgi:hypothetical protein
MDRHPIGQPAAARRSPVSVATRSLYWFEGTPGGPLATARKTVPRTAHPLRLVHAAPPVRTPRTLSPSQREALNALIGLGATLDDTFTLQELRSQFRALARAYHPDRHQAARRESADQLARTFVTLRRAYEVLKDAA